MPGRVEKPWFEKVKLKDCDKELAWMEISVSNILYLPSWDSFGYKRRGKPYIICEIVQYEWQVSECYMVDGVSYDVFIKTESKSNHITYSNPESYLKKYPGIDELELFSQMLNAIRNGFDIWKD